MNDRIRINDELIESVSRLAIHPGDVLVIRLYDLNRALADGLDVTDYRRWLRDAMPEGTKILILDADDTATVCTCERAAATAGDGGAA